MGATLAAIAQRLGHFSEAPLPVAPYVRCMKRARVLIPAAIALLALALAPSAWARTGPIAHGGGYTAFDAGLTILADVIVQRPLVVRFEPGRGAISISRHGAALTWPLPHRTAARGAALKSWLDRMLAPVSAQIGETLQTLVRGADS
jgi:hypothetical protein